MGYGTIRISDGAHGTLREMSRSEGKPMATLLDEAVETLRRQRFLEQVNAAYAALRAEPRPRGMCDRSRAPRVGRDAARRPGGRRGSRTVSRAVAPATAAEAVVNSPARGEVWLADLNPTRGHEQAGTLSGPGRLGGSLQPGPRRARHRLADDLHRAGRAQPRADLSSRGGSQEPDCDPVRGGTVRLRRATRRALGRRRPADDVGGRGPSADPAPALAR